MFTFVICEISYEIMHFTIIHYYCNNLQVTCSTGDDKIDPFLLSALNNPRDRLLLLKLDHELERFVSDTTYVIT